jgi:ABC-2 type transport system ATP-binding protein
MNEIVRIERLTRRYGSYTAVDELSLTATAGEILALLGPNGAGKTTSLRMLMGLLQPTSGSAYIRGLDCFRQRAEVMHHVGYLPDEPVFHDYLRGSEILDFVGEMHGLSRPQIGERSEPLVERFDLQDAMNEYAVNYSSGMKKKLALICAVLHRPTLLILDEPSSGLDPFATRSLHDLIRQWAEDGVTVFFSTHLLDQAERICHRVGILALGRLAALGPLEDLRRELLPGGSLEDLFFQVASTPPSA